MSARGADLRVVVRGVCASSRLDAAMLDFAALSANLQERAVRSLDIC